LPVELRLPKSRYAPARHSAVAQACGLVGRLNRVAGGSGTDALPLAHGLHDNAIKTSPAAVTRQDIDRFPPALRCALLA
jgi:hypothetical protein